MMSKRTRIEVLETKVAELEQVIKSFRASTERDHIMKGSPDGRFHLYEDYAPPMMGPPKQKIVRRAGFMNVYGEHSVDIFHLTRGEADKKASLERVACVEVKAIYEGDGL
jgi:hypothetical protein